MKPPAQAPRGRHILPDVIAPGIRLLICGSAAGAASAAAGAYYFHPGNRFWPTLHAIGLTPHRVAPMDYMNILAWGIGMTDLCKTQSGSDAALDRAHDDPLRLRRLIMRYNPTALAFNGKRAARSFFERPVDYGRQPAPLGQTTVFVLPSTAGLAAGAWDIGHWREMARFVRAG